MLGSDRTVAQLGRCHVVVAAGLLGAACVFWTVAADGYGWSGGEGWSSLRGPQVVTAQASTPPMERGPPVLPPSCLVHPPGFQRLLLEFVEEQRASLERPANDTRWVVFESDHSGIGGWADRLKGLYDSFALSVLARPRHALAIDYSHPDQLSRHLAPAERFAPWRDSAPVGVKLVQELLVGNSHLGYLPQVLHNNTNVGLSTNQRYDLQLGSAYREVLREANVSEAEWRAFLPMHGLFACMFDLLFDVAGETRAEYERMLAVLRPNGAPREECMSLQVRLGKRKGDPWKDTETFTGDTVLNGLGAYMEDELARHPEVKRFFVSADHDSVLDWARERLGAGRVVTSGSVGKLYHIDKIPLEELDTLGEPALRRVVVDHLLLGECGRALISESGYGSTAVWRTHPPPFSNVSVIARGGVFRVLPYCARAGYRN